MLTPMAYSSEFLNYGSITTPFKFAEGEDGDLSLRCPATKWRAVELRRGLSCDDAKAAEWIALHRVSLIEALTIVLPRQSLAYIIENARHDR